MDKPGFRSVLQSLHLSEKQINETISMAERFDSFLMATGETPSREIVWAFSRRLIKERKNTLKNYLALFRYSYFLQNNEVNTAFLDLIDGGEVSASLYRKVAKRFGTEIRDRVFQGIGVAPYGVPTPDKTAYLNPVIDRLVQITGKDTCEKFLSTGLRYLPAKSYLRERKRFRETGDIDTYLQQKKEEFVQRLESCRRENRLFFAQEITGEVLDFVVKNPEMGAGRRQGNILYVVKIPYMAKQYLAEKDPTLRRYYGCHCPWVREAIKDTNSKLSGALCYCSGGFHKKEWEVIFNQPLKVDVLDSILNGGELCRFAIYLPEDHRKSKIKA